MVPRAWPTQHFTVCAAHALCWEEAGHVTVPWDGQCLPPHHRARPTIEDTAHFQKGPHPQMLTPSYPNKCRPRGRQGWGVYPGRGQQLGPSDGFLAPGTVTGLRGAACQTRTSPHTLTDVLQARPGGIRPTRAPQGPGWQQLSLGDPAGSQGPGLPAPSLVLCQLNRSLATKPTTKEHGRREKSLHSLPPKPQARKRHSLLCHWRTRAAMTSL